MAETCEKCKVKLKQNILQCSGLCKKKFHPECVKITIEDSSVFTKIDNAKWFCDCCNIYLDFMTQMKEEIIEFENRMKIKFESLENMVCSGNSLNKRNVNGMEVNKKSYAEIAGEVVVIKPKTKQESKTTKEVIRKTLNPTKLEVGITQIKDTKEGGVLIKCNSKEEIEKIKIAAEKKLKRNYEIKTPEQRNPRIKIVDIEENIDKEILEESINKQNSYLNHEDAMLDIKVVKKMKSKYMAIAECDPMSLQLILKHGKLSIGWSICRVFEYIPVFRCYKCGDYDHKASECKREEKCLKCISVNHKTEDCVSEQYKCFNCISANEKLKLNLTVDHSIFDVNCPVFLRKVDSQKKKIKVLSDSK